MTDTLTTGTLTTAVNDLGQMAYNTRYEPFLAALGLEDDDYARDKYADLRTLGRAMARFSNRDLVRLIQAYHSGHAHCEPKDHDRSVPDPLDGQAVTGDGLLACNDCGRPIFWCNNDQRYHHVDLAARCFLIQQ